MKSVALRKEKGRNLAYSYSSNSSLGLYLAVIQLHLRQAAPPYAAGLPQDTPSSAQSWHCPSLPSKGCAALGWISATCPHGYSYVSPCSAGTCSELPAKHPAEQWLGQRYTPTGRTRCQVAQGTASTYAAEEGFCDMRISQKPYNIAVSQTKVCYNKHRKGAVS